MGCFFVPKSRMLFRLIGIGFLSALIWEGCSVGRMWHAKSLKSFPPPKDPPVYSIWLLGDAGRLPQGPAKALFDSLKAQLTRASSHSMLVFLGDNVYPQGLASEGHSERSRQEEILARQVALYESFPGTVLWLAGNHDWQRGGPEGWPARLRQEAWIEKKSERGNVYLPDSGCPGPYVLRPNPGLALVALDTQWWLHETERPMHSCGLETEDDFLKNLKDTLAHLWGSRVVLVGHHPLLSRGPHGGAYPWQAHVFPLAEHFRWGWIPMPLLGTAYVLMRRAGYIQDLTHRHYQRWRDTLLSALKKHPGSVYVSGHDHGLQYLKKDNIHFLVSGSGSETSHIVRGRNLMAAANRRGYVKLEFYNNMLLCYFYTFGKKSECFTFRLMD